jgi:hypothetical protein
VNKRAISRWTERWYKFKKIFFLKRFWRLKRVDGPQIQLFGCAGLLSVFSFSASLSLFFLPLTYMNVSPFSTVPKSLTLLSNIFLCLPLFRPNFHFVCNLSSLTDSRSFLCVPLSFFCLSLSHVSVVSHTQSWQILL